jgi:hypothetical protein
VSGIVKVMGISIAGKLPAVAPLVSDPLSGTHIAAQTTNNGIP